MTNGSTSPSSRTLLTLSAGGVLIIAVILLSFVLFPQVQGICMKAVAPSVTLTGEGVTATSQYLPAFFTMTTGRHDVKLTMQSGATIAAALRVFDAKSPVLDAEGDVHDLVRIDFCNFLASSDVYVVMKGDTAHTYRIKANGDVVETGLVFSPGVRDGVPVVSNAVVSPDGQHIVFNAWDAQEEWMNVAVSDLQGKNIRNLVQLHPIEGEVDPGSLGWSGSGTIVYRQTRQLTEDEKEGTSDTQETTTYQVNIDTGDRQPIVRERK